MSNKVFHFSNTGISSGQRFYLKDDVSGIFVRNLNIDSNFPVVASNLVYNTGNQTISGIKTFASRPTVNGTGVLLSGEASATTLPSTIVYTTGNQLISGNKTFTNNVFYNQDLYVRQNIRASGTSYFYDNLNIQNNLTVSGNSNMTGTLNVLGNATFRLGVNISGTSNTIGNATFSSGVNISGDLRVTGNIISQSIVLTKSNQTISGVKTFTDKVLLNTYTSSGYAPSNDDYRLNIAGNVEEDASIQLDSYGGAGATSQIMARKARGNATNLSGLLKNDVIFNFAAKGYVSGLSGYSANSRAQLRFTADEDWVARPGYTGQGTFITIRTTNIGSGSTMDKVIIGTSGLNVLDGNIYISGNPVVNTTSDQTVNGNKTFPDRIIVTNTAEAQGLLFNNDGDVSVSTSIVGNKSGITLSTFQQPTVLKFKSNFVGGDQSEVISIRNNAYTDQLFGPSINTAIDGDRIVIYETGVAFGNSNSKPYLRLGLNNIISERSDSKFGIGTLFPQQKVHISGGNLRVDGNISANNINISGTGDFNAVKVSSIDKLFLSGVDLVITGNSSINVYNAIYISGNPVLTGELLTGKNSFTVFMQTTNSNPANDNISYFNNLPGGPTTNINNKIFQIGEECIAKKASWNQYLDTFTGVPNQNATGYFINVTTNSTGVISTVINAKTFGISGFSYVSEITPNIAVKETDYVVCGLKWGNYTVGLRPSGWRTAVNIYCYN